MRKGLFALLLRFFVFLTAACVIMLCAVNAPVRAQVESGEENLFQIEHADSFEYDGNTGAFKAEGSVAASYKDMQVFCDVFEGNTKEGTYTASGEVEIHQKDQVIHGNHLVFNTNDNTAHIENAATIYGGKVFLSGKTLDVSQKKTTVTKGVFTTCNLPLRQTHYHLEAKQIVLVGKDKIKAKGVSVYFKRTKIFILPYLVLHTGQKGKGKEGAFSYKIGYDRKDKFFIGSGLRFQAVRGMDTKISAYYPVARRKIFPFVEEIYEDNKFMVSAGYGKKRMKDIRGDVLTVKLMPQIQSSFGPYTTKKFPVTLNVFASAQNIEEEKDDTLWLVKGRKTKFFLSAEHEPISLAKSLDLSLSSSLEKSFYHNRKNRSIFSGNVKLSENFSENFSSSMEYIRRQVGGGTPFLFDEVDLVKELKSASRWKVSKTLSLQAEIRYNIDTRKVFETELSVTNIFHCLEGTLSYNTRKKQISGGLTIAEF